MCNINSTLLCRTRVRCLNPLFHRTPAAFHQTGEVTSPRTPAAFIAGNSKWEVGEAGWATGGLGLYLAELSSAGRSGDFALADAKPCCLRRTFPRGLLIVGSYFLGTRPWDLSWDWGWQELCSEHLRCWLMTSERKNRDLGISMTRFKINAYHGSCRRTVDHMATSILSKAPRLPSRLDSIL